MNILICEDESVIADIITKLLYKKGHIIYVASKNSEALNTLQSRKIDLLITDFNLALDQSNFLLTFARRINPDLKTIVLSSLNTDYEKKLIKEMQANHFLRKPFLGNELEKVLNKMQSKAA